MTKREILLKFFEGEPKSALEFKKANIINMDIKNIHSTLLKLYRLGFLELTHEEKIKNKHFEYNSKYYKRTSKQYRPFGKKEELYVYEPKINAKTFNSVLHAMATFHFIHTEDMEVLSA